jgi:hypothetical protein
MARFKDCLGPSFSACVRKVGGGAFVGSASIGFMGKPGLTEQNVGSSPIGALSSAGMIASYAGISECTS